MPATMAGGMSFEMSSAPVTPDVVTSKILRRAEIAKMSRTLQDKLSYASYKNKMGLNKLSFDIVEAQVAASQSPKKKRRTAAGSVVSSCSSSDSSSATGDNAFSLFNPSSPNTAALFSDDLFPGGPATEPRLRTSMHHYNRVDDTPTVRARRTKRKMVSNIEQTFNSSMATGTAATKPETWRPSTTFCDSSPLQQRFHPDFRTAAGPNISFAVDLADSPQLRPSSPPSEPELPLHSFQRSGSPPRTPPPTRRKPHTNTHTSEGAQLLMHLASSPTPAAKNTSNIFMPSTPPRNAGNTPGGLAADASPGLFGFGTPNAFSTPSGAPAFNLADFCNVTPSPAQAAFGSRTPLMNKTPRGMSSTRRALDFDNLMPPSPSPAKSKGLNLELGGKLDD